MNLLDALILLPIAYFCYRGFMNGLVKEVLGIIGIVLAVFLTFQYMDALESVIGPLFEENSSLIPFVSAFIIFIGTLIIVNLIARLSTRFLETINLHNINRVIGMAFGILKSGIMVSAVLLLLAGFHIPSEKSRQESLTYSYVIYLAPWAYDTVAAMYPGAEDFADTVERTLHNYNPINNFPLLDQ